MKLFGYYNFEELRKVFQGEFGVSKLPNGGLEIRFFSIVITISSDGLKFKLGEDEVTTNSFKPIYTDETNFNMLYTQGWYINNGGHSSYSNAPTSFPTGATVAWTLNVYLVRNRVIQVLTHFTGDSVPTTWMRGKKSGGGAWMAWYKVNTTQD